MKPWKEIDFAKVRDLWDKSKLLKEIVETVRVANRMEVHREIGKINIEILGELDELK